MKDFFKNKQIGYYIVAFDIVLAIFLGIFFFATYKEFPAGYGGIGMASNAYAHVPEVIGLFMFLGAVVDAVVLLLPEFIWVHLFAIGAYCVSLMKQVYCIPNLIADEVNNVHYQGGSLPLCLSWLIITIIIIATAIVVFFVGTLKAEEEEARKKEKPLGKKLVKIAIGGGAIVVAFAIIMSSYGVTAANVKKGGTAQEGETFADRVRERLSDFADKVVDYDFDPAEFKLSEADNEYADKKSSISSKVGTYDQNQERKDADGNVIHKVYTFEGSTAEGWQGDYSLKILRITLWEDGLYNGNGNGNALNGYWYNVDEYGEECLVMMSSDGNNDMVGNKLKGTGSYYEWLVDFKASYNGGRLIKGNGLKYYPLIGMFVDTGGVELPQFKKGSSFGPKDEWTCMQVRNNMVAGSIFDAEHEVKWSGYNMNEVGVQTVTASWTKEGQDWSASFDIEVVE